ncbi:hypothetical protein CV_4353 [Chromobacterium violaceum ATCC 12472]|uniref:Uncharacterized protein n=1 Tax=Chromobacterium violaceum (strain ATCC 12472 / DSM 30191 / JCM 1249 / CCUG 213 / NBRC 12614 / NCIMB 9131 / NCTC 9757 / MK) TaxID=243365 RepID=Q7NPY9_CHRVO|nr:hypothetical protein CV_4353 [Chromobacterium violaceum ATCC 12472]
MTYRSAQKWNPKQIRDLNSPVKVGHEHCGSRGLQQGGNNCRWNCLNHKYLQEKQQITGGNFQPCI